ncbi:MAG: ribonuclease catalytic domain-containing protein [Clostridium sp.]|nr:ribonuclease catalytic domain-containing protein [Clostridium sp.]MCM1444414.1 ribonuclease catalytic domain-containing protein [Candidatus Amulumruptor caecigallinarius]
MSGENKTSICVELENLKSILLSDNVNNIVNNTSVLKTLKYILENPKDINEEEILSITCNTSILLHNIETIINNDILFDETKNYLLELKTYLEGISICLNGLCIKEDYKIKLILGYIAFELKNYWLIKLILENNPKYYKDKTLFSTAIDNYLNSMIYKLNDFNYYEKLLTIFIKTPINQVNRENINLLKYKLNDKINLILFDKTFKSKDRKNICLKIKQFISRILDGKSISDINYINNKYNISSNFPPDIYEEIENIKKKNIHFIDKEYNYHKDLTDKYVIAIDSTNTSCIDDAFSLEKENNDYILTLYISDVEDDILLNTPLDLEAKRRGFTIYLPKNYIPMLPKKLSNISLSLNVLGYKKVMAFKFVFSDTFELKTDNIEVFKAIIKVSKNYSYNQVDKIIKNKKDDYELLANTIKIGEKMNFLVGDLNDMHSISKGYNESSICTAISKFMVLINNYISTKFNKLGFPFLYCNNDNILDGLDMYKDNNISEIINLANTIYLKSYYSTQNKGHHALELDSYCHATNPLRNYASLTIQRLINDFLLTKKISDDKIYFWEDYLNDLSESLNNRKESNSYYCSEYLENKTIYQKSNKKK